VADILFAVVINLSYLLTFTFSTGKYIIYNRILNVDTHYGCSLYILICRYLWMIIVYTNYGHSFGVLIGDTYCQY